ncbi:MAG: magnesium transporter [Thermoleophilaceae bacterium]|nr:magnesium transporter [Thermoleophilaceae bacterium]
MIVDSAVYEEGRRRDGDLGVHEAMEACRQPNAFTWIGLYEPTEEEFESIRSEFDLHPLAVEDAINAHERPKLEVYGDMVFIVLKTARYVDPTEVITLGEILIFIGEDYIITVRHGEASDLREVRHSLEEQPELLQHGPGAVLHAIVDRVVDDYAPAIEGLGQDIDEVEDEVFSGTRANPAERIYKLKREVLQFSHAVGPLVDPVMQLARGKHAIIHPEVRTYFRDVNDHLLRAHDQLESFRDLLTSILEANLAQVTVRQNEDVRKISAFVAIVAVPTAIAGIYGMNFQHMPELSWTFGYPLVLGVMAVICLGMYRYFKKVGWLE